MNTNYGGLTFKPIIYTDEVTVKIINAKLKSLSSSIDYDKLPSNWFWTSTEYSESQAVSLSPGFGKLEGKDKLPPPPADTTMRIVRPILAF